MIISKNIPYGTLDIDTINKRIWLNCPSYLMRIQNINFKNIEEKFLMIDINGNDVYMQAGELENKELCNFLETIISLIIPKITEMDNEKQKSFLDDIILKIKDGVNNADIK